MKTEKPLYKRLWFWCVSVIGLYAVLGFIVLPYLLTHVIPGKLKDTTGINVTIEKAFFNPFTFELKLTNPLLKDLNNAPVFALEQLYVNIEPMDLITRSITLKSLKIKTPQLFIQKDKTGKINLSNILPPTQESPKEATSEEPSSFTFLVKLLDISQGKLSFKDDSKETPFTFVIEPLDYYARDISTKHDNIGAHRFEATSPYVKRIAWEGGISLNPLKFYGEVWLEDINVPALTQYGLNNATFAIKRGTASVYLPYVVEMKHEGPAILLNGARVIVNDFLLNENEERLAQLGRLSLSEIYVRTTMTGQKTFVDVTNLQLLATHALVFNPAGVAVEGGLKSLHIPNIKSTITQEKDKELLVGATIPSLLLEKLRLTQPKHPDPFAGFETLSLKDITVALPQQEIKITATDLQGLFAHAIMTPEGTLDLMALVPKHTEKAQPKASQSTPSKPWSYALPSITVGTSQASFSDHSLASPMTHTLSAIDLHIKDFNSDFKTPFTYTLALKDTQKMTLSTQGNITLEPLHVQSSITHEQRQLEHYQPYIMPYVNATLKKANVTSQATIDLTMVPDKPLQLHVQGDSELNDLLILGSDGSPLTGFKQLALKGIDYTHTPTRLHVKGITLKEPYAKIIINENKTTNLDNLVKSSSSPTSDSSDKPASTVKKPDVKIGPMKLTQGSADFADLSLPLKFATKIHGLEGAVSRFNLNSTEPSTMSLKGYVDKYGYANIQGTLSPFAIKKHADIGVTFKNIDLTNMTPYSGKFVGYAIKEGKLSLDLNYKIRDAGLQGDNKINLDSLTLGNKIESPDALNLPLDLALALLKDSNGQIDLDLPVAGDLNNPKFSYGAVVVKAITNLITGIITAPFRFLGSLLGIDGEKLKSIDFEPSYAAMIPSEMEKMEQYSKMLGKRPGIKLKIIGSYDETIDTKAIQANRLQQRITETMKTLDANTTQETRYQKTLDTLYLQSFTPTDYNATISKYTTLPSTDTNATKSTKKPQPIIDFAALNDDLRLQLQRTIVVSKEELDVLANERATTVKKELIKVGIKEERLVIEPPVATQAKQDKWIGCEVKIGS